MTYLQLLPRPPRGHAGRAAADRVANECSGRPRVRVTMSGCQAGPARFGWLRAAAVLLPVAMGAGSLAVAGEPGAQPVAAADPEPEPPVASAPFPVESNARVGKWIRRYVSEDRETFRVSLAREGRFGELIRGKLKERQMPQELLYLAMIESGFSPEATSRSSAAGVWQFMSPTATDFGLRVDEWVDERRDPVRATDAALDYLAVLHQRYGSWYLAVAAYNAGPSRVDQALAGYPGGHWGNDAAYWDIIGELPPETRDYVPKMLAASALARHAEPYGFRVKSAERYEYDRVWVPGMTSLVSVAEALGVATSVIRELNPHLVRSVSPPGGLYELRVPTGGAPDVVAALVGRQKIRMAD